MEENHSITSIDEEGIWGWPPLHLRLDSRTPSSRSSRLPDEDSLSFCRSKLLTLPFD